MKYLLDTNAWIHLFAEPYKLSPIIRATLGNEPVLGLSSMSLVEVCQKVSTGKLRFSLPVDEWIRTAMPKNRIRLLTINTQIAHEAYQLGDEFHKDPADRIITATARIHKLTLATSDRKLLDSPTLTTFSTR